MDTMQFDGDDDVYDQLRITIPRTRNYIILNLWSVPVGALPDLIRFIHCAVILLIRD